MSTTKAISDVQLQLDKTAQNSSSSISFTTLIPVPENTNVTECQNLVNALATAINVQLSILIELRKRACT